MFSTRMFIATLFIIVLNAIGWLQRIKRKHAICRLFGDFAEDGGPGDRLSDAPRKCSREVRGLAQCLLGVGLIC